MEGFDGSGFLSLHVLVIVGGACLFEVQFPHVKYDSGMAWLVCT